MRKLKTMNIFEFLETVERVDSKSNESSPDEYNFSDPWGHENDLNEGPVGYSGILDPNGPISVQENLSLGGGSLVELAENEETNKHEIEDSTNKTFCHFNFYQIRAFLKEYGNIDLLIDDKILCYPNDIDCIPEMDDYIQGILSAIIPFIENLQRKVEDLKWNPAKRFFLFNDKKKNQKTKNEILDHISDYICPSILSLQSSTNERLFLLKIKEMISLHCVISNLYDELVDLE